MVAVVVLAVMRRVARRVWRRRGVWKRSICGLFQFGFFGFVLRTHCMLLFRGY